MLTCAGVVGWVVVVWKGADDLAEMSQRGTRACGWLVEFVSWKGLEVGVS